MPNMDYMKQGIELSDQLVGIQQNTQLAEMGAAQLEQYGPEGQQWAQRLRQNPAAAVAMAKQYGGFAQIEAGLRYAAAAGRNATAEDLGQVSLGMGSPEGYDKILGGKAKYDTGRANLMDAERAKKESDLIWRGGVPGVLAGPELELRMALASGDPTKVREARDRLESMTRSDEEQLAFLERTDPGAAKQFKENLRSLDPESIRKLISSRQPKANALEIIFDVRAKLDKMTDFESPGWEFSIAVELNKALQPESAVLLSEAQVLYDNLTSDLSKYFRKVEGFWVPTGELDAEGRERLWNMTVDLTEAGMKEYKDTHDTWTKMNKDVYKFKPAYALITQPGSEYLDRIDEYIGKQRPTRAAEEAAPEKRLVIDPQTGKRRTLVRVDGGWNYEKEEGR